MKTYKELINHCKAAKNWLYVYGAKGKVLTLQQYDSLKSTYGSYVWASDKSKVGHICCDCSGLISSCTGILRGSTNYKNTATEKASIEELKSNWQKYVGWGIWMSGHIGVVSDIEGYYYAMDGSARNWAHRPLKDNRWEMVIKLKDIDYSKEDKCDVTVGWMTYTDGKWSESIGIQGKPIRAITIKTSKGFPRYRVHFRNGKWDDFRTRNTVTDIWGYAGDGAQEIDGIQMEIRSVPGYNIVYRVSTIQSGWLPWVTNYNSTSEGYAGIYGETIDRLEIKIVEK